MPRGNAGFHKVFLKGENEDFIVFVEDVETLKDWKKDRSIPLAQVVSGWKIFVTHRQGAQGIHDEAGKAILETEFGTSNEDVCITRILENGEVHEGVNPARNGTKNESKGVMMGH